MNSFDALFGHPKAVIAMLHFPGLPGRPLPRQQIGEREMDASDRDADSAITFDGLFIGSLLVSAQCDCS